MNPRELERELERELGRGCDHWRAGQYRDAHEVWEAAWRQTVRGSRENYLFRGLCQAAAAAIHGERGNWRGLVRLATRATDNVRAAGNEALAERIDAWARACVASQVFESPPSP